MKNRKGSFLKEHTFNIPGLIGRNKEPLPVNFTKYGLSGFITKLNQKATGLKSYKDLGINSTNLAGVSRNVWAAWNDYLYGKGKNIHFKKRGELNTIEYSIVSSNGKDVFIGLDVNLKERLIRCKLNGSNGTKAQWMTIKIGNGKELTRYEREALKINPSDIRTITIAKKNRGSKRKYYVQLTFRGKHFDKGRCLGAGQVGIDIGPSTVAVSSLQGVRIDKLASKIDNIEHEKWIIQRKLDRSRRASNPQNYNVDGTIKRGVKLVWVNSERYKKLSIQLRELYRRQAAVRKAQHIELANELLSLGDVFIVENNPIKQWAAKAKETKKSEKTGKFVSKKRFGKSIAIHAPAEFITILKNKVQFLGGKFIEVDIKSAASRFDFTNNTFNEHKLDERRIILSNGDTHQRDLLAAFNLQHYISTKKYDVEQMEKDYPVFCKLEREELNRYKQGEKRNDKSTIGAF